MAQKRLIFVTGNQNKLREAKEILGAAVPWLESRSMDLPELQGEPVDIAMQKCRIAAETVNGAVLVEDTCLCFNALHGLPGPYVKWFLKKTGHAGLNNLLHAYDDKTAYALCTFAFSEGPGSTPIVFQGTCEGSIVQARGPPDFGWDPIFQPQGYTTTFAEMSKDEKNAISHRFRALEKLRDYLAKHPSFCNDQRTASQSDAPDRS
ncbi:Inosine triphosphate pyrophosphatase [Plasmodiophora brassicae]|uniref:Inosine triphosphate pyrophosphatase n=1 Tax=Plasmodiophora brassicae TaxID=37360 RepID=A0A0G4IJ27_PLABS|nr:hypothetical protein PBRA_003974 [Plasmodiophora brassicae]SPQ96343.1 unnamed protein product [Plasmodiophora brassicae]